MQQVNKSQCTLSEPFQLLSASQKAASRQKSGCLSRYLNIFHYDLWFSSSASLSLDFLQRLKKERHVSLCVGVSTRMWVCVNGNLKSLQLCISTSMTFTLHVFEQHVEPGARPLLANTPAAVYHAGSGMEDSSLPVHMPSYQPTLSQLVNMFCKGNSQGNSAVKERSISQSIFVFLWAEVFNILYHCVWIRSNKNVRRVSIISFIVRHSLMSVTQRCQLITNLI